MIVIPILFLLCGYSLVYIVGRPVIHFTSSSLQLFLLSELPKFEKNEQTLPELDRQTIETNEQTIFSSQIVYPRAGYRYGRIVADSVSLDVPLYYGDSAEILRQGAGQYMGSVYPGELGTTLVAGHNADEFGKLIAIKKSDVIQIIASYGDYSYQIYKIAVLDKNAEEIKLLLTQKEQPKLILYTCYPIDSIGLTDQRLFVFAYLIKGPLIQEHQ